MSRYAASGVDIASAARFVEAVRPLAETTHRPEVIDTIGSFSGLFGLPAGYRDPLLVASTDGVGTKVLVAQRVGRHRGLGIDLVAMCVNDVAVSGASPLFFLDYLAMGCLNRDVALEILDGIAAACRDAGCALLGGETAQMPGVYPAQGYDLAGFAVGVVERDRRWGPHRVEPGDVLIGVPSSGVHANGFSLIRSALFDSGRIDPEAEFGDSGQSVAETLLTPTSIYVPLLQTLRQNLEIRSAAHITGGGLVHNVPRALPPGCRARIQVESWPRPPVFEFLRRHCALEEREAFEVWNMGIGLVLVVRPDDAERCAAAAAGFVIGTVEAHSEGGVILG